MLRLLTAFAFATSLLAFATEARAWYFPEHVVVAQDGLNGLPAPVREVIRDGVAAARGRGIALCAAVDVPLEKLAQPRPLTTSVIRLESSVDCVPYAALPALAGDHSDSASELRGVLANGKGVEITSAAAYEWRRFVEAVDRLPNTSLERMAFVHSLDVAFYFVDKGYELRAQATRAHFADAGRPWTAVLADTAAGRIDNALGQFIAHHMRSLALAARGDAGEALLEHGFALHFLEDAFAAGHLIEAGWNVGNATQRQRHDYYNARGLPVGRALATTPCDEGAGAAAHFSDLSPCWVTSGDGHLGLWPDSSDRVHVTRAVAKAQLQFALALDTPRVVAALSALGERERIAIGQLVEPTPWWTLAATERDRVRDTAARADALIGGVAAAIETLRHVPVTGSVEVGRPSPPQLFPAAIFEQALDVCRDLAGRAEAPVPGTGGAPSPSPAPASTADANLAAPCPPGKTLALGSIGTSLLRPLLADWPKPRVAVASLQGESNTDHGWAVQLLAATGATVVVPSGAPVDFFAPAISVAGGLSYRWGTYLPGRVNRPVVELNLGISDALHYDSKLQAGGRPNVAFLDQELRWPILYELLTSYARPFDPAKSHGAGHVVFVSGVRAHQVLADRVTLFGVDVELLSVALTKGRGAYPLYAASPEVRVHIGMADSTATQPSLPMAWSPTLSLALTGGYATFL